MTSEISRRKLLATTASSLLVSPAVFATALLGESPQILRQMAIWDEPEGLWRCWFEGQSTDVPDAVSDAQAIWGERVKHQHLNTQDLELLFGQPTRLDVPVMRVGCSTSQSAIIAVYMAFQRAGGNPARHDEKTKYAGLVLVSASRHELMLETYKELRGWLDQRFAESFYYGQQFLVDRSLGHGIKRVSVAIAT